MREFAVVLGGIGAQVGGVDGVQEFDAILVGRTDGIIDPQKVVAADGTEVGHRFHATQALRHVRLEGNRRERMVLVPPRFHNGAIPEAVADEPVVGGDPVRGLFPIDFGIEMRAGLAAVGHAVDEGQIAGVKDRHHVGHGGVERGEAVAQTDAVRVARRRRVGHAGRGAIEHAWILGDSDQGAIGSVAGILNGQDVVHPVVAAAQEDEKQLLAVDADVAFGEGAFEERRDVGERGQPQGRSGLEAGFQERASGNDVGHNESLSAYCSWKWGEHMSKPATPRTRPSYPAEVLPKALNNDAAPSSLVFRKLIAAVRSASRFARPSPG